jgi:hypothetical protein
MKYLIIILLMFLTASFEGCYYDVEEELYPDNSCDTSSAMYNLNIKPVIENNCLICHSQAANQGNVVLEGHANLANYASTGQLLGAIRHEPGFSPMPKGGGKLNDCDISLIEKWVAAGTPNN